MASDKDNKIIPHPDMSDEQITGAKIGFAIVVIMSICAILGLALPIFCPHTYERLKVIAQSIMNN